jgi:hypothetical protein
MCNFMLHIRVFVQVTLIATKGNIVAHGFNQIAVPGQQYSTTFDMFSCARGTYYCVIRSGLNRDVIKVVYTKGS